MNPPQSVLLCCLLWACFQGGSTESQTVRSSAPKEDFDEYWNAPVGSYELAFQRFVVITLNAPIEMMTALCREKCPLTQDQEQTLRKAAGPSVRRASRQIEAEMLIAGVYMLRQRPPEERSPAEAQFFGKMGLHLQKQLMPLLYGVLDKWESIATPQQREVSMEWLNYQFRQGLHEGRTKHTKEQLEEAQRLAAGRFTEKDIERHHIDMSGPRDLHDLPVPQFPAPEAYWHYRVMLFVRTYRLTTAQQAAARSILEECQARAQRHREGHAGELRRLWKQLVQTCLFPKESKVTLKDAVQQFRRASEAAVRPIYEEMQRRLQDLLTTKQKTAAGPPPPKPRWLELMEIALADEDSPAAGADKPPATRPAAAVRPTERVTSRPSNGLP